MSLPVNTLTAKSNDNNIDDVRADANKQEVSARHSQSYIPVNNITTIREDEDPIKKIVVCTYYSIDKNIEQIAEKENEVAKPMCLPVEIYGKPVGNALIDQGATRSIIRQTVFETLDIRNKLVKVSNMFMLDATGDEIPIIGRFIADLSSNGHVIGRTLVYVVANTDESDIVCDFIIGRGTLAVSAYPCVDMRADGRIYNPVTNKYLLCSPCTFERNKKGIIDLTVNTISTTISNKQKKKIKQLVAADKIDKSHAAKVKCISDCVSRRSHLTSIQQEYLLAHLLTHTNDIDVVENIPKHNNNKSKLEEILFQPSDQVVFTHLMSELDKCVPHSADEKKIISEIFSTFVPDVVQKQTHRHTNVDKQDDDLINEVEDIEFPFTPPTMKDDSPEYHDTKRKAIRDSIEKNEHLSDNEKNKFITLLIEYEDRFSIKGENMERTETVQHEIDTGTSHPFRERLRQYSPVVQDIIDAEVMKMLKEGVILPSKSSYASNLLLVRKPDPSSEGGMKNRVCASFVRLNDQTQKDSYPLPNIQYIFDKIGKSKWFTTMDLLSGFWQVMIKPEHRHKTAFITMRGLYEFVVMPFGLCNAPATFQRLMDAIILPEYRSFIETYIDDLMTHSQTFDDHLQHIQKLLSVLRQHKLVVKLTKCKFAQREVKFLGHVISQNKIKTNPEAVDAIKQWTKPQQTGKKALTAVRGFLGMVGWYRKFIPHFADIAKPLIHLTKKDVKFEWTDECQKSFETLRDALTTSPVLAVADPNKIYMLHTDASDYAMGAILMQVDDNGDLHPIAYASKTFSPAQQNYDTTDREALAIPWALQHFNTYCEGHKYTVITDHKALEYIYKNKDTNKRIHRLALKLQPYDLTIEYKSGKLNYAADLLSRSHQLSNIIAASSIYVNGLSTKKRAKLRNDKEEYEIEKILDKRPVKGRDNEFEYLIKWKGFDVVDNTWEPLSCLQNSLETLVKFEKEFKMRNKAIKSTLLEKNKVASPKNNADDIDDKLDEKDDEDSSFIPPSLICDQCGEINNNYTQLYVHKYRVHDVPIPSTQLRDMEILTDKFIFKQLQESEPEFRVIYNTDLGTKDIGEISSYERRILQSHEFQIVRVDDGLLYCMEVPSLRSKSKLRTQLRLCIPKTERQRILHEYHISNAHPGIIHQYDQLRERVWWPRMLASVVKYVTSCQLCQRSKGSRKYVKPQPMDIPIGPWTHVAVDHVGPLTITNKGNKYILVVVDRFTRYAEAFAVSEDTTVATAQAIIDGIMCRHGFMMVLQSDRGGAFVSHLAAQIFKLLGVRQVKTTAWHPQSNGVVEKLNGTLKQTLKIWSKENQTDWDELLPFALFAYNTSFHSTLQETPYYLNHGRQARTITDSITDDDLHTQTDVHAYAHQLATKLYEVHHRVREILNKVNEDRLHDIDTDNDIPSFEVGDKVLLFDPTTPRDVGSRKLVRRWKGPFTIVEKHSIVNYTVVRNGNSKLVNVHRMRKYNSDEDGEALITSNTNDIALAQQEVDALSDTIIKLQQRKSALEHHKHTYEASNIIENRDDNDNNHVDIVSTAILLDNNISSMWL